MEANPLIFQPGHHSLAAKVKKHVAAYRSGFYAIYLLSTEPSRTELVMRIRAAWGRELLDHSAAKSPPRIEKVTRDPCFTRDPTSDRVRFKKDNCEKRNQHAGEHCPSQLFCRGISVQFSVPDTVESLVIRFIQVARHNLDSGADEYDCKGQQDETVKGALS